MNRNRLFLPAALATLCASMLLTGCVDNDYDLSGIDATVGLGGDTLWLPSNNSSNEIQLSDILDVDSTGAVKIRPDGDYAIDYTERGHHEASVSIPELTMGEQTYGGTSYIDLPTGAKGRVARAGASLDVDICDLDYDFQDIPEEIVDLDQVAVTSSFLFTLRFPEGMASWVTEVDRLTITLPSFLDVAEVTGSPAFTVSGHAVTMTHVDPAAGVALTIRPNGITIRDTDFDKPARRLRVRGKVRLAMEIGSDDIRPAAVPQDRNRRAVTGQVAMEGITVNSVTGRFRPVYGFDNLGDIVLNKMPDFLTDYEVVADFDDPQVNLSTYNMLPLDILVDARLQPYDAEGREMPAIPIQTFRIPAARTNVVSLRRQDGVTNADTAVVKVEGMGHLLRHIPRRITIPVFNAIGDSSRTATIRLGAHYTYDAWTQSHLETPLTFADSAQVVYSDILDGWNNSVKHFRFMEHEEGGQTVVDGRLRVECDVENRVPVYLTLTAAGVDTDGNIIPQERLRVTVEETIEGSPDGTTPSLTHETIILQPLDGDVMRQLDGVSLRFTGSSFANGKSPITGIRLNAHKQTLRLTNFHAVKEGRLVGDFN